MAQSLAYVAGFAGVVAGTLAFRDGETVLAVVAWVLTFAIGAILMIAAFLVRAMAGLMARIARLESDLSVLVQRRARELEDLGPPIERDPWLGH